MKSKLKWLKGVPVYFITAFFVAGAIGNILALGDIPLDYERWGYPDWFHYITGILELSVAILLLRRSTRFWGAGLGFLIMGAACATVLLNGEVGRLALPLVMLLGCAIVAWFNKPKMMR